jgi:hypothetical protein
MKSGFKEGFYGQQAMTNKQRLFAIRNLNLLVTLAFLFQFMSLFVRRIQKIRNLSLLPCALFPVRVNLLLKPTKTVVP